MKCANGQELLNHALHLVTLIGVGGLCTPNIMYHYDDTQSAACAHAEAYLHLYCLFVAEEWRRVLMLTAACMYVT